MPPVLVREEAMYGTGFFPTDRAQVYETIDGDCLVGTSEVPLAAMHMQEFLEAEQAAAALRRLLQLLPPRGRRRRPRHARHPARAPVRQGRDVQLLPARAERRRARAHPLGGGGDPAGARHPLPRGQHRRRRPGRPGGAEVRLRGLDAGAGAVPRGHELLQLHRLPGAAPGLPLPHRARVRASCTR